MYDEDLLYKLALNFIPSVGSVSTKNLINHFGEAKEVFFSTKKELQSISGIGDKRASEIIESNALDLAEKELNYIYSNNLKVCFFLDEDYPKRLKHINNAPIVLYYKGNINFNSNRTVAIIGTRQPTSYGKDQTEALIEELKQYNVTVISGLAYGIDTIAHNCALKYQLPTIGVLGNGLRTIYPQSNFNLSNRLCLNGGIISEFPYDTKPDRENFPKRNRIIAALSDVVVVMESAVKGGSFITAEFANEYSKDVFACPGRLGDSMSEGCNKLIKTHKAHMLTSVQDIVYITRWDLAPQQNQMSLAIDLSEDERTVFNILLNEKTVGLDALIYATQIQLSRLSEILINLEFSGLIKSLPGKKYILGS